MSKYNIGDCFYGDGLVHKVVKVIGEITYEVEYPLRNNKKAVLSNSELDNFTRVYERYCYSWLGGKKVTAMYILVFGKNYSIYVKETDVYDEFVHISNTSLYKSREECAKRCLNDLVEENRRHAQSIKENSLEIARLQKELG